MRGILIVFPVLGIILFCANSTVAYEKEIERLSASLTENITKEDKKTIAVVDFTDLQGNVTELGRFIAEEFSASLAGAEGDFEVIDRTHLKVLLKEHKLAVTDIIDPSTARKLGQIAGVDALITGSITPFGDSVRISVKILDTTTAKVIGASRGNIAKTKAIEELLAREIGAGASASPGRAVSPVPNAKAQQRVETRGFAFDLNGCIRSGDSVNCNLIITNKAADKELALYRGHESKLFDDLGNVYDSKETRIGNQSSGNYSKSSLRLISGIPTKAMVSYHKVSTQAKNISLIEIKAADESGRFTVQFRGIRLSR